MLSDYLPILWWGLALGAALTAHFGKRRTARPFALSALITGFLALFGLSLKIQEAFFFIAALPAGRCSFLSVKKKKNKRKQSWEDKRNGL